MSESPERLFEELRGTSAGVPSLWSHQADVLRTYHENFLETPDVALELPTGSGKTLPALLVAEWRRTALNQRVAYACPTVQLSNQVHEAAKREGISSVALHGSHWDWDTADVGKYERSDAIAVTTYSTIFNSNPALAIPQTLLFDDAHAGEHVVAAAWSVSVSRYDDLVLYDGLLDAIRPELTALMVQRLDSEQPDPKTRTDVLLLPISALERRAKEIDAVLAAQRGNMKYRYTQIRAQIEACLLYFGWEGFLIRPYIPPTNLHPHFCDPEQRIYISATLGEGGELERAFGRSPIKRLPVPAGWEQRSSGRRFFVFPELLRGDVAKRFTRESIKEGNKALLLTPSDRQLAAAATELIPDGFKVYGKEQIESNLTKFSEAEFGVLALANRYDGLDLADESCRITVLSGLPAGAHLQERFFVNSLRAARVLDERLRTRVIQGAGRCTRGLKDHSVVIIVGDDLTRFFQRKEVRSALRPETQAEIDFGIANSTDKPSDLLEMVRSCLDQDDDWMGDAEPIILDMRREAIRVDPPGTDALANSVGQEVKAWGQAWRGEWLEASETATEVSQMLTEGVLSPYRAFWLYLAAAWRARAAADARDSALLTSSQNLLAKAHAAARGMSWLRELAPLDEAQQQYDPVDELAVRSAAVHAARTVSASKYLELSSQVLDGLGTTNPKEYEPALSILGGLLGAEAFKPAEKGRADSVWVYGTMWWLTLEAKSDAGTEGLVSMDDIRQTNTQLDSLSADRGIPSPIDSRSIIITPKEVVDPDAISIARSHVYISNPESVLALAKDAIGAWRKIRLLGTNLRGDDANSIVRSAFAEHRVLPSDVKERIAELRVQD